MSVGALLSTLSFAAAASAAPADTPAAAAEAPAAPSTAPAPDASATTLEEVVITAQKRVQSLKSVPISVSALTGDDIRVQRIQSYDDLSRVAPGVQFDSSATEGTTNISIRGVSSTAGSATVGLYIDDVSVTTKNLFYEGSIEPRLVDLDRVEVLRGPQGTLYGDSSEGGTIRYITQAPNMTTYSAVLSGDASQTFRANGGNFAGSLNVNLPIVKDVFAVRISASTEDDAGWINHYTQNLVDYAAVGGGSVDDKGVNSQHVSTAHITAKITPGWGLIITPAFYYQHFHVNDSSAFYLDTPGLGLYDQDKEVREFGFDDFSLASLSVKKPLGFADVTSVTGLFHRVHDRQEDGTFFNSTTFAEAFLATVPTLPAPVNPAISPTDALNIIGNLPSAPHLHTKYMQFTQELRLSSPDQGPDARLHWVAGLYFAQQRIRETDFQQIPHINSVFQSLYGVPMEQTDVETYFNGGVPGTILFPDDIDESDVRDYRESQYSVFGQVDYDPFKHWHIGLGARYEIAAEHFSSTEIGFYQIGNISPYYQNGKGYSFTPKVTLSHDFSSEETVYASAGKGFRLGGPTGPITFGPETVCAGDFAAINQTTQPIKFAADSLWTYELGSKGSYLGNRLSVNAAGFYTSWQNIQQQIYLPTCGYYFTQNVGDARIYGGELEAVLKLTSSLKLNLSYSNESATITKTINPVDVPTGANLIDVPQATLTAGASYSRTLWTDYHLLARLDYSWTGHSYGSYQYTNANYYNPSYGVVNASIAVSTGPYEVSLYAKNLLNDQTIIQSPEINTVVEGYTVRPRTIGLTLTGKF
jgi:outer membrane receptor protein involved in Fe transport